MITMAALLLTGLLTQKEVIEYWKHFASQLLELYRSLHSEPELSFEERSTAQKLSERLRNEGYEVIEGIAGTGLAGVMRNGSGPVVLVRTDLDALPVKEQTGAAFASTRTAVLNGQEVPVMHACGHDVHMSIWLGLAQLLVRNKDKWQGTVVFVGQPAEETGAGAKRMLDEGLYQKIPRPNYALALHVDPYLPSGTIGYTRGAAFANVNSVDIVLKGRGGHGAAPHKAVDPIVMAAALVQSLQTIVSREMNPTEPAVVTIGSIHGGTRYNIIPDEVKLQLTVRSYSAAARDRILNSIRRMASAIATAYRAPATPEVLVDAGNQLATPATVNDAALVDRIVAAWQKVLPKERVIERSPEMIGEDFGRFGEVTPPIPSFMFRLGTTAPEELKHLSEAGLEPAPLHSSYYLPDVESAIPAGIEAMYIALTDLLKR
ncbi:MAG: amidohydrolase [Acidobacteriota bacterium]|nr:amidohydrolase [Blastocatellia bacterium]MDW8413356.1 amidohydrolase [Acidobacteriota bacterium]